MTGQLWILCLRLCISRRFMMISEEARVSPPISAWSER